MERGPLYSLRNILDAREQVNAKRSLAVKSNLIDFCSNDYLGFSRNSELLRLTAEFIPNDSERINGSTGSRLLRGNSAFAEELEGFIADYHGAEAALLFNSGYDANLGFFSCVPQRGDTVLYDRLIHASIHDGMRLGKANTLPFKHNDLDDFISQGAKARGNVFVAVESIYSMDGDAAPLQEISAICQQKGWSMVVDEAHALGVFGTGLASDIPCFARLFTYGKAMGCHGAAWVGTTVLREYLINFARPFIYSTSLPLHSLAGIRAAYALLNKSEATILVLRNLIQTFLTLKSALGYQFTDSNSAIQSLLVPGNNEARSLALSLQEKGYDVRAILSPTVPAGQERLRICLHAYNTVEQLKGMVEAIAI